MPQIKDSKTLAAASADKGEGRRPTIVSAPAAASPELSRPPPPPDIHGARQVAYPWRGRPRRGRPWSGRRDRAPRGTLLVGAVGLAASARRRRVRSAEPRQARPQNRRTKSAGGGTCTFATRQSSPETAVGARRSDHRNPKKSCGVAGSPSFERRRVLMDAVAGLAPGSGLIAAACTALGLSRASLHRRQALRRQPPAAVRPRPTPKRALVAKERKVVLDHLREPRFVDLAPAEVHASLLDQGVYLCSIRAMYRVLAEHDEVRETIATPRPPEARASRRR